MESGERCLYKKWAPVSLMFSLPYTAAMLGEAID